MGADQFYRRGVLDAKGDVVDFTGAWRGSLIRDMPATVQDLVARYRTAGERYRAAKATHAQGQG